MTLQRGPFGRLRARRGGAQARPILTSMADDLTHRTALQIADGYRSGELSPPDVVEHFLARIADLNGTVGAFITVTADAARRRAADATQQIRSGTSLPPVFGVPIAIKDLTATAGVRTTFGSAATDDFVPAYSDEVVNRLEHAGLISLGKTNTPEFGCPCYTEPTVAPPARTPFDLDRSAGGSSGGAATAVASGLLPWAQGSDGGGSIRIPASVCGLVGFKPSRGRVSRAPVYGDVSGLSTSGPLTTTVRDSAAMLDVMSGRTPGDAVWAAPPPDGASYLDWCERDPGRLRIGRFSTPLISDAAVHPDVLAVYEELSRALEGLGHQVEDIGPPLGPDAVPAFERVWAVSAAGWPVDPRREHLLRPLTRWLRERGFATTAPQFSAALVAMAQAAARALTALSPFDVVLTPTLAQPPAAVGGIRDDDDPAADFEAQKAYTPFAAAWNVTGMPAVTVPAGWTAAGLPIGGMLAARPGEDHVLYSVAAQLESQYRSGDRGWNRPIVSLGAERTANDA